jgi:hypothetical protein
MVTISTNYFFTMRHIYSPKKCHAGATAHAWSPYIT